MKTVLTIAGSDCSGGAGIQADIKTITAHKLYAMSVITALTAQNTTGVYGISEVSPAFVEQQLTCVFTDIVPDAVKIGMVSNQAIVMAIAKQLRCYDAKSVVVDPVMISTSGCRLISEDAQESLCKELFPLSRVVTPNIPEAEVLTGQAIRTVSDMEAAARTMSKAFCCSVLVKGGHRIHDAQDYLWDRESGEGIWFLAERIDNPNTHGTGCTLSSAIACGLASGLSLQQSVQQAKDYLTGALRAGLDLGRGSGPLSHTYALSW